MRPARGRVSRETPRGTVTEPPAEHVQEKHVQDRLQVYAGLLRTWSARINLISRRDMDALWERHILDSLQLCAIMPADADHGIDLGSGAGFPGLVLAIATGVPFVLIESDRRKAAFLAHAARATRAPVTVIAQRAETCRSLTAPLVTARALAPLPELLGLAAPFAAPGGCVLLPKGANVADELTAASAAWNMQVERFASKTALDAVILRITHLAARQR